MINVNLIILVAVAVLLLCFAVVAGRQEPHHYVFPSQSTARTVGEPAVTVISHSDNNFALR